MVNSDLGEVLLVAAIKTRQLEARRAMIMVGVMILLIPIMSSFASAMDLQDLNPFGGTITQKKDVKDVDNEYLKANFNEKYGMVALRDTFLWIPTGVNAEYTLTYNTEDCLINCKSRGRATLYDDGTLFDGVIFYDRYGKDIELTDSKYYYLAKVDYIESENVYKDECKNDKVNGTNVCYKVLVETKNVTKQKEIWTEYDGKLLSAGNYEWMIEASKDKDMDIDMIPIAQGKDLDVWAWWNTGWLYKKSISVSGEIPANYSIKLSIDKNEHMNTNFSDLRFLNSTESGEFDYWIESYNSTTAIVWVEIPNNSTFYMYYGNPTASSSTNLKTTFLTGDDFDSPTIDASIWTQNDALTAGVQYNLTNKSGYLQWLGDIDGNAMMSGISLSGTSNWQVHIKSIAGKMEGRSCFGISDKKTTSTDCDAAASLLAIRYNTIGTSLSLFNKTSYDIDGGDPTIGEREYIYLKNSTRVTVSINGTIMRYENNSIPANTTYMMIGNRNGYANFPLWINYIFVSSWIETEPVTTFGTEERRNEPPLMNFTSPTPENNTQTKNLSFKVNMSIVESNLATFIYNFNRTNYTMYNSDLVLMYNFENYSALGENDTTFKDLSLNGYTGKGTNTEITSGVYGKAVYFNGSALINCSTNSASTNLSFTYTINAWVNTSSNQTNQVIVQYRGYDSIVLRILPRNSTHVYPQFLAFRSGDSDWPTYSFGPITTANFPLNEWHMITASSEIYNDTHVELKIYQDGVYATSKYVPKNISTPSLYQTHIGALNSKTSYFNGSIDEVRIWNRSLSASEISQMYMSNLQKYNSTQWYFYVNQSKSATNGLDFANYTYQAFGVDTSGLTNSSEMRSIEIIGEFKEMVVGTPALVAPINGFNSSISTLYFNSTANITNGNMTNATLFIWNGSILTNITSYSSNEKNTSANLTYTLSDGNYTWGYRYCGANASITQCAWSENRTLIIDTTPPSITITQPSTNQTTLTVPYNVSMATTITDLRRDSCWYSSNGGATNITYDCVAQNVTISSGGVYTINIWSNDTFNNVANSSVTYLLAYVRPLLNITTPVVESDSFKVWFNITADYIYQTNASVNYEGVSTLMNLSSNNGTLAQFYANINAKSVTADTYANISIDYFVNGDLLKTANQTQFIYNIQGLTVTNGTCSPIAYSFSLADEENLTALIGTFDYNFIFGLPGNTSMTYSYGSINNTGKINVCFNNTLSSTWNLSYGEIQYYTSEHVKRRFYLFSNTVFSGLVSVNTTLYAIKTASATPFSINVQENDLNYLSGYYTSLLRWYPDLNEYKIVEMGKTDNYGHTVNEVKIYDVDYRMGVYQTDGTLVKLFNPIRFVCSTAPCAYSLYVDLTGSDYTSYYNVQNSISYNSTTKIVTFIWSDPSQDTNDMNLSVYIGDRTVCSESSASFTGVLTCNLTGQDGSLRAVAFRTASPQMIIASKVIEIRQILSEAAGSTIGLGVAVIFAIILFLIGAISPVYSILLGVIALIPAYFLGAVTLEVMIGFGIIGGLVVYTVIRRS